MTQDELDAKHAELFESEEWEDDPDSIQDKWHQYLQDSGLIEAHYVECNWGEFGVIPFVGKLVQYVNEGKEYIILEDPDAEGTDHWGYLVFPR